VGRGFERFRQQVVQPHELPQLTVGAPAPAQVAVHSSTPQLSVEPAQAFWAVHAMVHVPVPQSTTVAPVHALFEPQVTVHA